MLLGIKGGGYYELDYRPFILSIPETVGRGGAV